MDNNNNNNNDYSNNNKNNNNKNNNIDNNYNKNDNKDYNDNNNNNKTFLIYKLLTPPSKLKFEANLSREDSQSTKHSQKPEMISYKKDSLSRKSLIK